MTYTVLIFVTRRQGMAPPDFEAHFEDYHVPLIRSITGPNFPRQHTRRYIQRTPDYSSGLPPGNQNSNANWPATSLFNNAADPDIDAIAELVFGDEAGCKKFFEIIKQEDAQRKLAADEELFLDRGKLKVVALNAIITNSMPFPGE